MGGISVDLVSTTPGGGVESVDGTAVDNTDPLNPIINDLMIGRTIIVSTLGLSGVYADLTDHFNDINAAIQAVQSVNDVIVVYPCTSSDAPDFTGQWSIGGAISYPFVLNIKSVNRSVFIVFNDGLPGCTDVNISGNGQIQFNSILDATIVNVECASFASSVDLFVDGGNYKFNCAETFNVTTANFVHTINLYVTAVRATVSEAIIINPVASIISFKCHEYYGTLNIDDSEGEDWKYVIDSWIHYAGAIDRKMVFAVSNGSDITNKLIIKGDMNQISNLVMIELNATIWKKENGNITHSIQNNNEVTSIIPIINLINSPSSNAGFIGKSCNLFSVNGQRTKGLIVCNNAFGSCYLQIDSMNATGDAAIIASPFVVTADTTQNVVDLKGMCNDTVFTSWLDANCVSLLGGTVDVPNLII